MASAPSQVIRVGIIGAGARLRLVAKLLLNCDPRLQLCAVADPDPVAISTARRELSGDWRAIESARELIADDSIDWVMIGSWNCFHAQHAIDALRAGKNVFCEKPLATTFNDCLAVRDAVRSSGRTFVFGLVLRHSPHYQFVRSLLDQQAVGELVSFEFNETLTAPHGAYIHGNWRRTTSNAGSHVLEKCCHDLDLANWMAGSDPTRVASFGGRRIFRAENAHLHKALADESGVSPFTKWRDHLSVDPFAQEGDILDHQVVILEYANGVRATFHTNAVSALPERRFYLLGTHGAVRADAYSGAVTWARVGLEQETRTRTSASSDGHNGGDERMVEHLAATMLEGTAPIAGIDEALRSAAVAFAIDMAQTTGQVVSLQPMWDQLAAAVPHAPQPHGAR